MRALSRERGTPVSSQHQPSGVIPQRVATAPTPRPPSIEAHEAAPCSCGHSHGPDEQRHARLPAKAGTPLVSGRGLRLERNGRVVIDDVDIDIGAGEIVTLIGPNGAGKSSLVRLLLRLEPPQAGTITHSPAARIGYVPQRFHVDRAMPLTVERFLTLGQPDTARRIPACLAEVGAGHVQGSQLARLSGGELQRVVMARALLRDPTLLVLDEPLSGVDTSGEAELYALIQRLSEAHGLGVLLVSHDLHVVMAKSDRVICLNRHVCCSGVPETVAAHPEYMALFGPDAARTLAIYRHHHDHAHDIAGGLARVDAGQPSEPDR